MEARRPITAQMLERVARPVGCRYRYGPDGAKETYLRDPGPVR